MPSDLLIIALVAGLGLFILHIKSHIKFILLGLYVGIALADIVAVSIYNYVGPKFPFITKPAGYNVMQLILLLLPTLILGLNHAGDKKHWGLSKRLTFMILTPILLVTAVLRYLPDNVRQEVLARSMIAFQVNQLFIPIMLIGVAILVVESFHHKKDVKMMS